MAPPSAEPASRLAISVTWRPRRTWNVTRLLERVARYAAEAEGFRTGELSIAVVGARAMSTLHERYLQMPGPTDVLTFDLGTDRRRRALAGEVVICADVARQRAGKVAGATSLRAARSELALYVVHGVLHLAGYDDGAPATFRRMHKREDELLAACGLGRVFARGEASG